MAENTVNWTGDTYGTWAGIQRTTEPMWRTVRVTPPASGWNTTTTTLPTSTGMYYFIGRDSEFYVPWEEPVDPNDPMRLPEGF